MNVLGIETSCDETAASVVCDGRVIRSNVVSSQVDLHSPYGGVVPEIASRHHVAYLPGLLARAVAESGLSWNQLQAVAVTYGPGLASSLLVGLSAGKALALRLNVPLVGVNHLEAHLYSVFLAAGAPRFAEACPLVAMIVSGGHTCLVRVEAPGIYRLLGRTLDDAAGEAFDKGATLLGLGYPGGPAIERAAAGGDPSAICFPRAQALKAAVTGGLDPDLCFSFSGLKTALRYYLQRHPEATAPAGISRVAASYQEAIVAVLVRGAQRVVTRERVSSLAVAGGVSLNQRLRSQLKDAAAVLNVRLLMAEPSCCVDNAAMVAGLAGAGLGIVGDKACALDACPNLEWG